jgi:hypothetical protein
MSLSKTKQNENKNRNKMFQPTIREGGDRCLLLIELVKKKQNSVSFVKFLVFQQVLVAYLRQLVYIHYEH